MNATSLVLLLLGLVAGLAVGWLAARRRADLVLQSSLRAAEASAQEVVRAAEAAGHASLREAAAELSEARIEIASLHAELDAERSHAERTETLLRRNDAQLKELFSTQAAEALQRNAEAVIQLAQAQLAKARYDRIMAGLRLRQASGQLTPQDVASVDGLLIR